MNQQGQTILEALIAIFIVVVGLFSAMSLVLVNIRSSEISTDKLNAYLLSWEGVEAARNIRDTNWLNDDQYDIGINDGIDTTGIVIVDPLTGVINYDFSVNDINSSAARVYVSPATGAFVQATAQPVDTEVTKYSRLVTIEEDGPDIRRVISEVRWSEKGNAKSVISEIWLYNWQE